MDSWTKTPPKNDGHFYYHGIAPNGLWELLTIVQVVTVEETGERWGWALEPPTHRGDLECRSPVVHADKLENWKGKWCGPENGFLTISNGVTANER